MTKFLPGTEITVKGYCDDYCGTAKVVRHENDFLIIEFSGKKYIITETWVTLGNKFIPEKAELFLKNRESFLSAE
ncbi:hypothetical protein C4569_03640 [Candidatus Parcubacteria bacterium]|nr:MAG: hypothetical protein C4569_03640 [Candidatus Parcubacteria bacterium]